MREVKIEKVVLNIGTTGDTEKMKKGVALLSAISGKKVVETHAKTRIAVFKIRKGLPLGSKVTLRGKDAEALLLRLLSAVDNKVKKRSFTENGFSFGVPEYIDIPEVKYDPKIGIIGLDVSVSLMRAGYRIKYRRILKRRIHKAHTVSKDDAIKFAQDKFKVVIE
ncbi:50S ribosomal protein L5 [Candidatus Woesearchaeota archaeon]|jgi:large subunit ribosomal protein L5|nr:50S ribosomal protein L5 [Candidatus Woesearchaeota archaeon]